MDLNFNRIDIQLTSRIFSCVKENILGIEESLLTIAKQGQTQCTLNLQTPFDSSTTDSFEEYVNELVEERVIQEYREKGFSVTRTVSLEKERYLLSFDWYEPATEFSDALYVEARELTRLSSFEKSGRADEILETLLEEALLNASDTYPNFIRLFDDITKTEAKVLQKRLENRGFKVKTDTWKVGENDIQFDRTSFDIRIDGRF